MYMTLLDDKEDEKKFEALYEKYKKRIIAICYNILKDHQLAEDAAVEVFFSLAKNFRIVKNLEDHKLDYYIVISSRNSAIDMLKKEMRNRSMVPYDDDLILTNENMTRYDHDFLKDCIKQLNFADREILYLKYSDGLEYKDIAKTLGISVAAARKRVQYAKDRLKKLLEKEGTCL